MGYLPGFATPRIVCDVPVRRQALGAPGRPGTTPSWASRTGRKNYRTAVEADDALALSREYAYYDPIHLLPEAGQRWWRERSAEPEPVTAAG